MSLRITEDLMTSEATGHSARRLVDEGGWAVTWLPDEVLTRAEAIVALIVAVTATAMQEDNADHTHPLWPKLDKFASQLGMTGPEALVRVTESTPQPAAAREVAVSPQVRIFVAENHLGTGQVGLTVRSPHCEITAALPAPTVDELQEALAAASPVPYLPVPEVQAFTAGGVQ